MESDKKDPEIVHQLIQDRAFILYKQRSKLSNDYITNWVDSRF